MSLSSLQYIVHCETRQEDDDEEEEDDDEDDDDDDDALPTSEIGNH